MGPGPAPQDAQAFIAVLDEVDLARYRVVGTYTRYDEAVRNALQDARQKILAGFEPPGRKRENHLIWAAPGTGKTYFVQQVAASLADRVRYHEVNLAQYSEPEFRASLGRLDDGQACLCLIDECDAKPQEPWPYEVLLPYLDAAVERGARLVFVLAGSSGESLEDIKQRIAARPKGTDLLSRIPTGHEHVIASMSLGDRLLIVLSQMRQAGAEAGRDIRAIEKLGLYYVALNPRLANARQLREFAVRAVERVPRTDDRVKYDHLFVPGDPENKAFWVQAQPVAERLVDSYVTLTGGGAEPTRLLSSATIGPPSQTERQRDARLRVRPPTKYAQSGEIRVAYQVSGSGPIDVVWAPGTVSHLDLDWDNPRRGPVIDWLNTICRLIRFDKRGTGLSDRPTTVATLEERTDDIRAVMDAASSNRAVVFGNSEGASMACLFAATYPERTRSLMIWGGQARWVQAADYRWGLTPAEHKQMVQDVREHWPSKDYLTGPGAGMGPNVDPAALEWSMRVAQTAASPSAVAALEEMNGQIDIREILPTIRVPTLVMNRTGDPAANVNAARDLAAHIPGARFVEFPGNFHAIPGPEFERICAEMESFILRSDANAAETDRFLTTMLFIEVVESSQHTPGRVTERDRRKRYRAAIGDDLNRFKGIAVEMTDDRLFARFDGPGRAIRCAIALTRTATEHGLEVRSGLHTGECELAGNKPIGIATSVGRRIVTKARPGEVLVSSTVKGLVAGSGFSFRDRGLWDFDRIDGQWHIYGVVIAADSVTGIPHSVTGRDPSRDDAVVSPALTPEGSRRTNLPRQLTSFIGREREIDEVKRLLPTTALLTLHGPGGCGKTRLAFRVAADLVDQYPDGVWVAEFAALSDPGLVPTAVATALDILEQAGTSLTDTLKDSLRRKAPLLVMDNCEHVVSACAELTDGLLRACPNLRILATSREPLGVPGETVWDVPSLSVPPASGVPTPEQLIRFDAVWLFVERAAASKPGFSLTASNAAPVAEVCSRLEGIPLALELAAARVRVLTMEQIAARLGDRFRLLTGGGRTTLPRQQTLRATMDWSYGLCSETERTLLRRLSVFAGGWTVDAAETVCAGAGVDAADILDLLTSLADKSLVIAETQGGEAWYRLLETVRQYAREKLVEGADTHNLGRRHCTWYLGLAEDAGSRSGGPAIPFWLDRLEREHDNVRAALDWSGANGGDAELGLCLAVALVRFWEMRGYVTEGRRWLEVLTAQSKTAPPLLRATALNAAGILAYRQGDYPRVSALCSEALAVCEAQGDRRGAGRALHFLAHLKQARGDYAGATEMMERSVGLHRAAGDAADLANSVDCLGEIARSAGDNIGARVRTEEALTLYRNLGHVRGQAHALHNLAYIRLHEGDATGARALFRESLTLAQRLRTVRDQVFAVAGLASASLADIEATRVTRLLGAAGAALATIEVRLEPAEDTEFQHAVEAMRTRLGSAAFATAWAEGQAMSLEQAIEYALAGEDTEKLPPQAP